MNMITKLLTKVKDQMIMHARVYPCTSRQRNYLIFKSFNCKYLITRKKKKKHNTH